jgi:hypothetical protein
MILNRELEELSEATELLFLGLRPTTLDTILLYYSSKVFFWKIDVNFLNPFLVVMGCLIYVGGD